MQKSYAEREAQYQAARERIFRESAAAQKRNAHSAPPNPTRNSTHTRRDGGASPPSSPAPVKVARSPRGPVADNSKTQNTTGRVTPRGFAGRKGAGSSLKIGDTNA